MEVITTATNEWTKLMNFHLGKIGIQVGNQQFTVRNLTVNNADVGECRQ